MGGSDVHGKELGKGGNTHFGREQCEKWSSVSRCWGFEEGGSSVGGGLGWVWGLLVAAPGAVSGLGVHVLWHWKKDHPPACRSCGRIVRAILLSVVGSALGFVLSAACCPLLLLCLKGNHPGSGFVIALTELVCRNSPSKDSEEGNLVSYPPDMCFMVRKGTENSDTS